MFVPIVLPLPSHPLEAPLARLAVSVAGRPCGVLFLGSGWGAFEAESWEICHVQKCTEGVKGASVGCEYGV